MDPPGSSAVRWRARSNNADPFHSAKATRSTPPTSRAAATGSSTGSPAVAVIMIPTSRGTPNATGGQIR